MKKGLLGLLVIALTVVGCQNYDDQFDSLNDKIASLNSEISSLKAIQTSVTALGSKVDALAGSALSEADLKDILDEVNEVKTSVAAIEDVTTEVDDLNNEVDLILERLSDILSANAFYEGNLVIKNLGQLANAHELIKTGADDPTVTVRGNVDVVVGSAGVTKDSIASVNLILAKIRSVQGTATVTSDVDADVPALTYVTGDVHLNGTDGKANIKADKLMTIDGEMIITGIDGVVSYPALGTVGSNVTVVEVTSKATVTTLALASLTAGTVITAAGELVLAAATNVHLGGTLPEVVTLAKCVDFQHTTGGAMTSNLFLTLGGAAPTMTLGASKLTGITSITTKGNVNLPNVTEISTTSLLLTTAASEFHFPAVTKITGTISVSAEGTVMDFSSLKEIDMHHHGAYFHGVTALNFPELTHFTTATSTVATLTAPLATSFTAPKMDTTSSMISLKPAAANTISVKNIANTAAPISYTFATIAKTTELTVAEQKGDLNVSYASDLKTLNFTGFQNTPVGEDKQTNVLTLTVSNTKLTDLNIGATSYLKTLNVTGTALVTLNTAGAIINTNVVSNASLTTFGFAHTHLQGDRESTVKIGDNEKITSVDMSSLSKVGTVSVTGNAKLTSLVPPSATVLATSLATINVDIYNNKLPGTYTPATAPTGTVTYVMPTITSTVLAAFKPWIQANIDVDIAEPIGGATAAEIATNRDRTHAAAGHVDYATGSGVTANAVVFLMDLDETDNTSTATAEKVSLQSLMAADTGATAGATGAAADNDNDNAGTLGVGTARELATVQ
jgi:uncharacterized protein YoxC